METYNASYYEMFQIENYYLEFQSKKKQFGHIGKLPTVFKKKEEKIKKKLPKLSWA